jgi:hypothetical protein
MKKIIKHTITAMLALVGSVSCDYLDITPDNMATLDYAFGDRYNAQRYLFTCYSYIPPIGDIDADPAMSGADEIWQYISYTGFDVFRTFTPSLIARGEQSVTNPILNCWDGYGTGHIGMPALWKGIRDCNIFLENIPKVRVDMIETERIRWIAEAKFLKAYYHMYLLQTYGPIPIMDENMPISASVDEVKVYREPIDDVVEYIIALFNEAMPDLPDFKGVLEGTEAGRANQLIARSLIAWLRVWAASDLVNGNQLYVGMVDNKGRALFPQTKDPEKWTKAVEACEEAITYCESEGRKLYTKVEQHFLESEPVFQLQSTLRQIIGDRWNDELIWGGTRYDCNNLVFYATPRILRRDFTVLNELSGTYAPTLKMVEQFYSSNGVPIDEDLEWIDNEWYANRYKIREETPQGDEKYYVKEGNQTVYLHYNREPRFYAHIGFDKGIYIGHEKWTLADANYCDFLNLGWSGFQGGSGYSITGYACKKFHPINNSQASTSHSYNYFPFPVIRLAELYLLYAEAVNEAEGPSGPHSDKMFERLDAIRARAGLEGVKYSWEHYSKNPDKPSTYLGLQDIIRHERTVELMFEGKRYWDLRRWNTIQELNIQPQGWTISGETPEDFYKVTNVYSQTISFSTKDYFAPIKESNLYVNDNLVQNYGW